MTGYGPTGTVTFDLYNNGSASGTPLFTDTESLVSGVATSAGYTATATGTDYWVATYNGDSNNKAVTSVVTAEPVMITPYSPSINTSQQPASAVVGSSIADKATVTGYNPTGTVTFDLYNNGSASGIPLFTDTESLVSGVATSAGYTATATGTDYWVATYNGDSNNKAVTSVVTAEPVMITPYSPSINTSQQPATAVVGTSIADKATVTGYGPTGTVTFDLYNNGSASGTPLFTDTESLVSGVATSAGYTATATGTDYWVATYNGDSNNKAVTSVVTAEPVMITPDSPSINTSQQPTTAVVGSSIADKATVTGYSPTGTVTFDLYNNGSASGTPLFTDTESLVSGVATSAGYTATATGTDYWVATYNGDSNNKAVTSCHRRAGDDHPAYSPSINTTQQPATPSSALRSPTRPRSAGYSPTGTVTFDLYNNRLGLRHSAVYRHRKPGQAAWPPPPATRRQPRAPTTGWRPTTATATMRRSPASSPPEPVMHHPPIALDQHQPAAGHGGRRHLDRRPGHGHGGYNPTGTVTFDLYNNAYGHRHAAVYRHGKPRQRRGHLRPATRPQPRAPTTGWRPTTATATTRRSPASSPPSR